MSLLFLNYSGCSTCKKAKKFLNEKNIKFIDRPIIEENPSYSELESWIKQSKLPIKKFFNTSGVVYKELNLKDKLPQMSDSEQIKLLSSNGKLVKRPLLITDTNVLVGFKPEEWEKIK